MGVIIGLIIGYLIGKYVDFQKVIDSIKNFLNSLKKK
jgi:hypothetical protein